MIKRERLTDWCTYLWAVEKTKKSWYLFLPVFWAPVMKMYFCRGYWTLGFSPCSIEYWNFPNISFFLKIIRLSSFGNSWGNSHIKLLILDIKFRFTRGEWSLYKSLKKFHDIINKIVNSTNSFICTLPWLIVGGKSK